MEKFPLINEKLRAGEARRAEFGPIWLDLNTRSLRVAGSDKSESLDPSEYQILWLLVRANGNRITEQEIMDFIYEEDKNYPDSNILNQRILRIRKKLEELTGGKVVIDTQRRSGWTLRIK